mgnify:CR=1 FL=1
MFSDEASIKVKAGKGGDGLVSFRREKFEPWGGPDGGNGGSGGNIFFEVDLNLNTLSDYLSTKHFESSNGTGGAKKNCAGKAGEDLILKVPLGTKIVDSLTKELIFDLNEPNTRVLVAKGGKGGFGNSHFKTSTRQAPKFAELGEEGQGVEVDLELQLVADCAIIGIPSAGKSTLISVVSNAKPKIADYPFTTLIPNLGVVKLSEFDKNQDGSFVVADIPGLIEGASTGKGLGIQFLRHVQRAPILIHLVDILDDNFIDNYSVINNELKKFSSELATRPQFLVFNKIDAIDEEELSFKLEEFFEKFPKLKNKYYCVSAVTHKNLNSLIFDLYDFIVSHRTKIIEEIELNDVEADVTTYTPHLKNPKAFTVEKVGEKTHADQFMDNEYLASIFEIKCPRLEQISNMTDYTNRQALARVYDVINKLGINKDLRRAGIKVGDIVLIDSKELIYRGE